MNNMVFKKINIHYLEQVLSHDYLYSFIGPQMLCPNSMGDFPLSESQIFPIQSRLAQLILCIYLVLPWQSPPRVVTRRIGPSLSEFGDPRDIRGQRVNDPRTPKTSSPFGPADLLHTANNTQNTLLKSLHLYNSQYLYI